MKGLAKRNAGGAKAAAYLVPATLIAAIAGAGAMALTRNRSTAVASAVAGAILGLGVVGYQRR